VLVWHISKNFTDEKYRRMCYAITMDKKIKNKITKAINYILAFAIAVGLVGPVATESMETQATSISQIQTQITEHENQLQQITEQISELEDEQDLIEEMISDLNAEIINTMTSIGLKEDEIALKEEELAHKQTELVDKQVEIDKTQQAYEEAKAREEQQYEDMLIRIRAIYENGTSTYLGMFLQGSGLGDLLNRMDYVEKIYEYDRLKLEEYEDTKNQVHDLWDRLEAEKMQLQNEKANLETDRVQLQVDRDTLESQKQELDSMLAKKKKESANFETEIKRYQQEAAAARALLQQEKQQLQQLQASQNAGNYTPTSYTSIIDGATGSTLGKNIAKYACQYIGNPYVYGGTSLTKGADCSGFTFRVYKDFGYSLPRTSREQRSAGTGVNYSDAQPGDLICYDGHVGLYIGGGKIVHASSKKTGIKVSTATYRKILAVRRIIQ